MADRSVPGLRGLGGFLGVGGSRPPRRRGVGGGLWLCWIGGVR